MWQTNESQGARSTASRLNTNWSLEMTNTTAGRESFSDVTRLLETNCYVTVVYLLIFLKHLMSLIMACWLPNMHWTCSSVILVFKRLCTAVSCRAMCTGRRRHGAPQSALSHSRSTKFPSVQHDKLWPTSIFSYAGPHAWNSLPEHLRQTTSIDLFKRSL